MLEKPHRQAQHLAIRSQTERTELHTKLGVTRHVKELVKVSSTARKS